MDNIVASENTKIKKLKKKRKVENENEGNLFKNNFL